MGIDGANVTEPAFDDHTTFKVVINAEEQYSLWPADKETPAGWRDEGRTGNREECLAYIKDVWTDMRPRSVRKEMGEPQ